MRFGSNLNFLCAADTQASRYPKERVGNLPNIMVKFLC